MDTKIYFWPYKLGIFVTSPGTHIPYYLNEQDYSKIEINLDEITNFFQISSN